MMMVRQIFSGSLIGSLLLSAGAATLLAQEISPSPPPEQLASIPNSLLWRQHQALQAGVPPGGCQSCGRSPTERCGCKTKLFPWHEGLGNCDQWCVGPKWEVQADALILFREDADLNRVISAIGGTTSLVDQFDHDIGGRLFVTGYNESGFGLQVGWEGVDSWTATAAFDPVGTETRTVRLNSRLNSLEINFLPKVPYAWKLFSGFRYVELADNLSDARINDKPIPAPIAVPAAPVAVIDTTISHLLKNRLVGFQVGARRNNWHLGERLTIGSFFNAGVYSNQFQRNDVSQIDTTIIIGDDIDTPVNEFSQTTSTVRTKVRTSPTEIAFLGEAGITSSLKINQCIALRGGYQVMLIDGVGQGLDAYFSPGINNDTLIYHGLQFGLEYRR